MASLISDLVKGDDMPIYDNVEFARGCDLFLFRAKTDKACWELYNRFLYTVPYKKVVKAYNIGLRPDYPIPVARYFIEVCVDDRNSIPGYFSLWTRVDDGRLNA